MWDAWPHDRQLLFVRVVSGWHRGEFRTTVDERNWLIAQEMGETIGATPLQPTAVALDLYKSLKTARRI